MLLSLRGRSFRHAHGFTYATADTVINRGDVLIVAGKTTDVERLADLT